MIKRDITGLMELRALASRHKRDDGLITLVLGIGDEERAQCQICKFTWRVELLENQDASWFADRFFWEDDPATRAGGTLIWVTRGKNRHVKEIPIAALGKHHEKFRLW